MYLTLPTGRWTVVTRPMAAMVLALVAAVAPGLARADSVSVSAIDLDFAPRTVTVHPGDTVVWTNAGAIPHTVTSAAAGFDSGLLVPGQTFAFTFTSAGTFAYVCTLHPGMAGTVVVVPAVAPAAPARPAPAANAPQTPPTAARPGNSTAAPVITAAPPQNLPAAGTGHAASSLASALPELLLGSLALCAVGKFLLRRR